LPAPPQVRKKSKLPWIIAGVLLFFLVTGGVLAGAFFLFVKPRLDERSAQRNADRPIENINVSTPTPASSVETPSPAPTPEDTFVPPAGTVQFVNSGDELDGKLAEHYFDFSFYYPESWERDSNAGVAGAKNFVKLDLVFPPVLPLKNFEVW